ncbi:MAG: sulfatase, partial [Acetobacteraceae bacterium]|nr:sulfatase [Acetobacteraceae bacterium]
ATILDAAGAPEAIAELGLPGASMLDLAGQPTQERLALSEFHTYGPDGITMLRSPRYKYVHYVGAPPQLFDLETDPEELTDLGRDNAHAPVRAEFERAMRAMLDPEAVDARAKADQARMIAQYGGEAAVRARERAAYTPPPTAKAG